ncbi:hypothetical protein D3C81_2000180 [compost metagenome]
MSHLDGSLASVTVIQAHSHGHVAGVCSALVLAHSTILERRESHAAEGIAELAQVFDLANADVSVGLELGFGVGTGLAANKEAAAGGCIEVVFCGHG